MRNPETRGPNPPGPRGETDAWLATLGLARLSPAWVKAEIVGGLAAATLGVRLLPLDGTIAWAGAVLVVLGIYLAMAGNRSHLYQAMNHQNATLAKMIRDLGSPLRDLP